MHEEFGNKSLTTVSSPSRELMSWPSAPATCNTLQIFFRKFKVGIRTLTQALISSSVTSFRMQMLDIPSHQLELLYHSVQLVLKHIQLSRRRFRHPRVDSSTALAAAIGGAEFDTGKSYKMIETLRGTPLI
jgi:hypothetical protein